MTRPGAAPLAILLAAVLGCLLVLSLMPLDGVLALHAADQAFDGDRAQHIIGQRYFIADAWRWPPLRAVALDWPGGTNIALTDSIPLIAVPAKLLRAILPPGFHAILLWLALCYVLQPVAAVFALRAAGVRGLIAALSVAVIALSLPSFLYRFGHASLSAHFLILFALGVYLRIRAGSRRAAWLGPVLLLPASLLVHPYLMLMVAAILAAAPVSVLLSGWYGPWRSGAAGPVAGLIAGLALTAALAIALGYTGNPPAEGFGIYAMDLLSPLRPAGSTLFPGGGAIDEAAGLQEGYQYLGAGVFLLVLAAAAGMFRGGAPLHRLAGRHIGLLFAAVALTALALSGEIRIGHQVVYTVPEIPDFLQHIRGSGRLFWPVAYMLIIGGATVIARTLPRRLAAAILIAAAFLQFVDTDGLRWRVHEALNQPTPWLVDATVLRPLLAAHRTLTLWPPFGCGSDVYNDPAFLQILLVASISAIRTNTMYVARNNGAADCSALGHIARPLEPGEVRVFLAQAAAGAPAMVPDGERRCRQVGALAACSLAALPGLPAIMPPVVPFGSRLAIGDPMADAALGPGWGPLESEGIWTEGGRAVLTLRRADPGALHLTVWGHGFAPTPAPPQLVTVFANDRRVATWSAPWGVESVFEADLPADEAPRLTLRLDIARPVRPADIGMNADTRSLGFFVRAYRLEPRP